MVDRGPRLDPAAIDAMRDTLGGVADDVVAAITDEVPSYENALAGSMGEVIRNAVVLALGGFLQLAADERRAGTSAAPTAPAVDGAYQLGRGEARSGRTTEALLAAYRIGARVSWRQLSTTAVAGGVPAETLVPFAELVFAYIDQLSAASVAGHNDELATTGRVRQRLLDRVARHLLTGAPTEVVLDAAARAEWPAPTSLTAVLLPESQVRPVVASVSPSTLVVAEAAGLPEDRVLLLVPDVHAVRRRAGLLRTLRDRSAVAGPAKPWLQARASFDRGVRAHTAGLEADTEAHLPQLVLTADPEALTDLREQALRPLAALKPAAAEKLTETLRSWLLHQGRRDAVAAELFVHPQTVRYRMGQLREIYGDRLEDPDVVLALVVALGHPARGKEPLG